MFARVLVAAILTGWLIFGDGSSVCGQVELAPRLEDIAEFDSEDRYGGYVAVSLEEDLQHSIVQNAPPGEVHSAPPVLIYDQSPLMQPMPPNYGCPPWRPCGPQNSFGGNWLFMQTFAGADFRPACARHDTCLMSGCTSRKCCDKMFLWELDQACDYSAFPILCRMKARQYYLGVRLFGWLY